MLPRQLPCQCWRRHTCHRHNYTWTRQHAERHLRTHSWAAAHSWYPQYANATYQQSHLHLPLCHRATNQPHKPKHHGSQKSCDYKIRPPPNFTFRIKYEPSAWGWKVHRHLPISASTFTDTSLSKGEQKTHWSPTVFIQRLLANNEPRAYSENMANTSMPLDFNYTNCNADNSCKIQLGPKCLRRKSYRHYICV